MGYMPLTVVQAAISYDRPHSKARQGQGTAGCGELQTGLLPNSSQDQPTINAVTPVRLMLAQLIGGRRDVAAEAAVTTPSQHAQVEVEELGFRLPV